MVTPHNEFLYIINFDLYTLYKTLFDATEHNLSVSHFRSIWTLFLLLNTFWHEWTRLVTPRNKLLYIICFYMYTLSKTLFHVTEHNHSVSHFRYIWTQFLLLNTFWHEWPRLVTTRNELHYIISFEPQTVSKTFFDAP
jgi:hypothetical protein